MEEIELLLIEIANFSDYVQTRKTLLGLSNKAFSLRTGISDGEISKIINKKKKSVSLHSFYNIAVNSGDTIENVRDIVYTHRNLELKKDYELQKRTNFGTFMRDNMEGENTFEKVQAKTGIDEKRLIDIYFNTGAPEPYEFLLIEKAVKKKPGEMMKEYIEKFPVKKGKE
jgi:transcriptional regulator with XRE-family HTH domain